MHFLYFRIEKSTDQVIKPVNIEALSKWTGAIPDDVLKDMEDIGEHMLIVIKSPTAFDFTQDERKIIMF